MKVYLNRIDGIADAIVSMYMSKRSWTREKEIHIREVCDKVLDKNGFKNNNTDKDALEEFDKMFSILIKWGKRHMTMLRFIDFSFTVEGLHRGAQDDFDSHAQRLNNRIIRSSTRLANFGNEKSNFYQGKILTTDEVCELYSVSIPSTVVIDNVKYIKSVNGYIREDLVDNKDIKRGLYMLSIPSNFIYKCNCTEFSHIVKERDKNSTANPELKIMIEDSISLLSNIFKEFNRDFFYSILN